MKKFLLLMSLSILLQSCFSYTRALDFNAGEVQVNQDAIIYSKTKQVLKIPVKDISGVQAKEFSAVKSLAIPTGIFLVLALLLGASSL